MIQQLKKKHTGQLKILKAWEYSENITRTVRLWI